MTGFGNLESDCRKEIWESAITRELPDGQIICHEGDDCGYLPLVLAGSLRVYKAADNGRGRSADIILSLSTNGG